MVQANSSLEDQKQVFTFPSATYVGVYGRIVCRERDERASGSDLGGCEG